MKTINITLLWLLIGVAVCQAQTKNDADSIQKLSQPLVLHLDNLPRSPNKPLVIAQGKELVKPYNLEPSSIKSMVVIGSNDPRRIPYGSRGQHGVILLELKPNNDLLVKPPKE